MKQWFCQEIYFRWRGVTPVCTVKWWKSVLIHLNQWVTEYTFLMCIEAGRNCTVDAALMITPLIYSDEIWFVENYSQMKGFLSMKKKHCFNLENSFNTLHLSWKWFAMTNDSGSRTAQGLIISDERYFESEKGAQRALQAGYLGWLNIVLSMALCMVWHVFSVGFFRRYGGEYSRLTRNHEWNDGWRVNSP